MQVTEDKINICVIGLGYVGLPLAVEFGKKFPTVGYDISPRRISSLSCGIDTTLETNRAELESATQLKFSCSFEEVRNCNVYIVTVPTPINPCKQPDLRPLIEASKSISQVLNKGDYVIYESTVYPGATEEVCVPILEQNSGLVYNEDFFCGYSPERANPGDKEHRLTSIVKVTSGSNLAAAEFVDELYQKIITAGTFKASSIKVAEAAKIIENTQRDVNIGLINELALIFNKLEIDTEEVLLAAGTKWNFLSFRPGLVGGHCIGVDPYYLMHKARSVGCHPEVILAGRRMNDRMGLHIANQLVKAMLKNCMHIDGSRVLVMGFTFKENCPDFRNTKVFDVVNELQDYGIQVDCYDPWCDPIQVESEYGIKLIATPPFDAYDAIIIAVAHQNFIKMGADYIKSFGKSKHLIYDIKYVFPNYISDLRL